MSKGLCPSSWELLLSLLNLPKAAFLRVAAIEAVPWWPEAPSLKMKSPGIKVAAEMRFKAALSVRVTITRVTYLLYKTRVR